MKAFGADKLGVWAAALTYFGVLSIFPALLVFLLWLWISNIFVLLGAELNAELERSRALEAGEVSSEKEQFVELRETEKLEDE